MNQSENDPVLFGHRATPANEVRSDSRRMVYEGACPRHGPTLTEQGRINSLIRAINLSMGLPRELMREIIEDSTNFTAARIRKERIRRGL